MKNYKKSIPLFIAILIAAIVLTLTTQKYLQPEESSTQAEVSLSDSAKIDFDLSTVPKYNGKAYVTVNSGKPYFSEKDLTTKAYEIYGELDSLKRCTTCYACIGQELMPTEKRESISSVKPTGWQSVRYDFVDGGSLYNRCHLIGFQLTGENANKKNLITGTRYLNVEGMLPFEDQVAQYITQTSRHVMYRVTPVFKGNELLARGVLMEGYSVEDKGKSICFCVYCYNVQPGVKIDYKTGNSSAVSAMSTKKQASKQTKYVVNTNNKKFHLPDCNSVNDMNPDNKKIFTGTREELIENGYTPCGACNP